MNCRRRLSLPVIASTVLLAAGLVGAEPAAETPPIGYDALLALDKLPLLVDWPAYQDSSYSRQDINQDAVNFLRVESNGDQVLTDTDGPGVIYRFWSTGVVGMQMSKECRLRFYFDWETEPRLDVSIPELFGDKGSRWPFVPPLSVTFESGVGGGEGPCNLCYVPIPFAKHLKIVGRNVMFYHVDYHKLPKGTAVESFSMELAERHRGALEKAAKMLDAIPARPGGSEGDDVQSLPGRTLPPGEVLGVLHEGEGYLGTLGIKITNPASRVLRGVVLEIAFEKAENVCVRVPVGDFFGTGCGDRRFKTLPAGMTDDGYYSYWPMPFRKLCSVALRNDGSEPVKIERVKLGWFRGAPPANSGYFHARYVEDHDIAMAQEYHILDIQGRGKFVGTNVTMQNARGAQGIFFLEGDEKIYVDGERYPSRWLGTGTEDYFNGAYFWNAPDKSVMVRPYGGLTFLDWGIGRVCAYRWHILDFIDFQKDIRVNIEHGGVNEWPGHYQSVAYYYLDKPSPQPPLPSLAQRLPKTPLPPAPAFLCCELGDTPTVEGKPLEKRTFSQMDPEYESQETLLHGKVGTGEALKVPLQVPGVDEFTVVLFLSGSPDGGRFDMLMDGKKLGEIDTVRPAFTPWLPTEIGPVRIDGGKHEMALKLVKPAGGETPRPEAAVGVVAVQLRPRSKLIDAWSIVGNWPCPKEGGWEVVNPPEKSQDPGEVYKLPGGGEARWREHKGDYVVPGGGDWVVAYGLTYIQSPDDRRVACFIGKDDGLKVWVNDTVVFDKFTFSHGTPDSFYCVLPLKKGWNKVLVKSANWSGSWAYCLRPGDPDHVLRYARKPD